MSTNILMPALSPTMEEGNLAKWHVKEGDRIKSGDVIAEIETDKATMEVEAVDEGILGKILVPEGAQGVKVNAVIATMLDHGEGKGPAQETATPAAKTSPATIAPIPGPTPVAAPISSARPAVPATPAGGSRILASPLARRLAKDLGVNLGALRGSGPHGRIVKADLDAAKSGNAAPAPVERSTSVPAPATAPMASAPSDQQILKLYEPGSYDLIPHDNIRKIIAKRLVEAKQTIPHFYLSIDTEIDALLRLRTEINEAAPRDREGTPAWKVSVNDMIIKAFALALRAVPAANATWTEGGMLIHKHADVGVAVAIPGGLITPIVRNAEEKRLSAISTEMKDFVRRAKDRKLAPHEYQGGSSAVSNLGMYGVKDFAAVINPPHSSILAVGAGIERPVARNGAVAIATIMTATLSTDHRAVDGALGATLLSSFKRFIEKPTAMLV